MNADGTLSGDFWSGNWHHETWTAVRDDDAQLPDAFKETKITDESKLDEMVFRDLAGVPTRVLDLLDESGARARVIEVFGTWCPNCADAGRELVDLKSKYADDLAVVGLAFEITEDFDRSVTQVRHYEERMGSDWPILIAGLSDKSRASEALPVLDRVRSYPTLIFLNERNEVEAVYTGFSGPATGDAYIEQRERFEGLIEQLISE
jgi:thiol-disulfide isomerase/thioredoxin